MKILIQIFHYAVNIPKVLHSGRFYAGDKLDDLIMLEPTPQTPHNWHHVVVPCVVPCSSFLLLSSLAAAERNRGKAWRGVASDASLGFWSISGDSLYRVIITLW